MERDLAQGSGNGQLDVAFAETKLTALVDTWQNSVEELGCAVPAAQVRAALVPFRAAPKYPEHPAGRATRALGHAVPLINDSPEEAQLGYALTAVILVAVAFTVAGAMHVHHETRPVSRPSRVVVPRVVRGVPIVASGDQCLCGGTVGRVSDQSGEFLGCTSCNRSWTMDGRKIVRR